MRNPFLLLVLFLTLASLPVVTPVWAADEKPAKADDAKKDDAAAKDDGGKKDEGKKDDGKKGEGGDKPPADVSGGKFAGDPIFVHLPPMVLPVISDSGVEQLVTVIVDIEVTEFNVADKIHSNMPKVMDAMMRHLYGGLGTGSLRKGKLVDVAKVKAKATAAVKEVIGDGIKDVLVQGVSQRML